MVVLSPLFIALIEGDKISLWRRKTKNVPLRTAASKKKKVVYKFHCKFSVLNYL